VEQEVYMYTSSDSYDKLIWKGLRKQDNIELLRGQFTLHEIIITIENRGCEGCNKPNGNSGGIYCFDCMNAMAGR
jgi:hypothetical protein